MLMTRSVCAYVLARSVDLNSLKTCSPVAPQHDTYESTVSISTAREWEQEMMQDPKVINHTLS